MFNSKVWNHTMRPRLRWISNKIAYTDISDYELKTIRFMQDIGKLYKDRQTVKTVFAT